MNTKKHLDLIILVVLTILIKIFSLFPEAVERYYSDGIYQVISKTQRLLLGWIPFSIGDILYFVVGLYLLVKSINFIRKILGRNVRRTDFLRLGKKVADRIIVRVRVVQYFMGTELQPRGNCEATRS